MKCLKKLTIILFTGFIISCNEESIIIDDSGTTNLNGARVTFWTDISTLQDFQVTVIGLGSGSITGYYTGVTPDCESTGCFNVDVELNTSINFYATAFDGTQTWYWGNSASPIAIDVTDVCTTWLLHL